MEAEIDPSVPHLYEKTPDPLRMAALNFYRDIARGVLK